MLSDVEEARLDSFLALIAESKAKGFYPRLSAYEIQWLTIKLKETNDELALMEEKLQQFDTRVYEANLRIDQLEGKA
jgi:hypothetical protein